jgi:putative aminopeptidase FrvX
MAVDIKIATPQIRAPQYRLLEQLCNACGVSGDEGAIRKIVTEQLKAYADNIQVDALGNVLVTRTGSSRNRLKTMVAAHMDEIGFMLTYDDGEGLFRFDTVGGIDLRQLAGKSVWIGADKVPGVIGAKPIHLTTANDLKNAISKDTLRIDVGPENKSKVKIGDRATFATKYCRIGPSIRAKALDDRLGVAILIELVKNSPSNIDLMAAFTVQEEVGLRGARVAAYTFNPDLAIALDSTPANDLPNWDDEENVQYNTHLGAGPAIYVADRGTLSDPRLIRHLIGAAEAEGIPYQLRQPGGGSTDASAIHRQRSGIPSISVSVPGRYAHTAAGLARITDWKNTLILMYIALTRLTPKIFADDRE